MVVVGWWWWDRDRRGDIGGVMLAAAAGRLSRGGNGDAARGLCVDWRIGSSRRAGRAGGRAADGWLKRKWGFFSAETVGETIAEPHR